MRDALGGTVTIVIIVFFIVVVLTFMAFNVNYTKAFRMKDYIITVYDEAEGKCGSECEDKINAYADEIGYKPAEFDCSDKSAVTKGKYCVSQHEYIAEGEGPYTDIKRRVYYTVETKIDIRLPIVDNVLGLSVFQISGNTKAYVVE